MLFFKKGYMEKKIRDLRDNVEDHLIMDCVIRKLRIHVLHINLKLNVF